MPSLTWNLRLEGYSRAVRAVKQGRDAPARILSIIRKEGEHYSNLCDDAYKPNMQRLTWSGIALHGAMGALNLALKAFATVLKP